MCGVALLEISASDPLNFSPIIYGLIALAALIGALFGFWRGVARQAVKTASVLVSVVFAYALSIIAFNIMWDDLSGKSVAEVEALISKFGINTENLHFSYLYGLDSSTSSLLFAIPLAIIVLPILFVLLFLISNAIMHAFYKLICYLCGFRNDRNTRFTRGWGAVVGIAEALIFMGAIFTPIVGLSDIARESVAVIEEHAPGESFTHATRDKYTAYVRSVSNNKAIRIYGKLGIGALYEQIATVEIDGEQKDMTDLVPDVARLVSDTAAFKGTHPRHLTAEDEARIKRMISTFADNPYLAEILAGAVRGAAASYEAGSFPVSAPDPYGTLVNSALELFKTSDKTNITGDLNTLSDAYFILSESGVLSAFDDGSDAMLTAMAKTDANGASTANRVTRVLRSNERTASLVTLITKLSITVMNDGTGVDGAAQDTYERVKEKINSNLVTVNRADYATTEEYTEKISEELGLLLSENGIELEEEITYGMAEYYAENFSDAKEITDDMASDIIFSYYDAYVKYKTE